MAWDAGEIKEREFTQVAAYIRSANTHAVSPHKSLTRPWSSGTLDGYFTKLLWFNDLDCAHRVIKLIKLGKGCYSSPVTLILPDFSFVVSAAAAAGSGLPMLNSVLLEASAVGVVSGGKTGSVGTGGALGAEGAGKSPDSVIAGFFDVTVVPPPVARPASLAEPTALLAAAEAGRSDGEAIVDVVGALSDSTAIGLPLESIGMRRTTVLGTNRISVTGTVL
jgi:hypothetical protein